MKKNHTALPLVAELRGKLADLQRGLRDAQRLMEEARLRVEQFTADVEATQRVVAMMERSGSTATPVVEPHALPTMPVSITVSANGAANGHIPTRPPKIDEVILATLKRSGKPMTRVEIRDALLLQNIPGAKMLIGSTHLFNVLGRMTKRGQLVKDGRNYRLGSEPVIAREPVNWERCAMVLTETGRPMSLADIARAVNQRWGLNWEVVNAKWAMKDRRQVFEVVHPNGVWGLKAWPEALKTAYRVSPRSRTQVMGA